jgi:hypothetical protein
MNRTSRSERAATGSRANWIAASLFLLLGISGVAAAPAKSAARHPRPLPAPDATVKPATRPSPKREQVPSTASGIVPDEYLVRFRKVAATDVPRVARELAAAHHGRLLSAWSHALQGCWLAISAQDARALAADPRIASIEANAVMLPSESPESPFSRKTGEPVPCGGDPTIACVHPQPAGSYDDNDQAAATGAPSTTAVLQPHPLWHLTQISHRTWKPNHAADLRYQYSAASAGKNVTVYLVDAGLMRYHQEFFRSASGGPVDEPTITSSIRSLDRSLTLGTISPSGFNALDPWKRRANDLASTPDLTDTHPPDLSLPCDRSDPTLPQMQALSDEDINPGDTATTGAPIYFDFPHHSSVTEGSLSHAEACASLIAGWNVGVAKDATIVPVKVNSCNGLNAQTTGMLIDALDWIATPANIHLPGVVSISTFRSVERANAQDTFIGGDRVDLLEVAFKSVIDAGIPVVASANNQQDDACTGTPARLSRRGGLGRVITVGGLHKPTLSDTDTEPRPWTSEASSNAVGSNTGGCVDVWAPAENIAIADTWGWRRYRHRGDPNGGITGTSFSAPIVAGMIARMLSEDPSLYQNVPPTQIADRVWERLATNATVVDLAAPAFTQRFGPGSPRLLAYLGAFSIAAQPHVLRDANGTVTGISMTMVHPSWEPHFVYQWYKLSGASHAGDVEHSTPVGGPTTSTLTLSNVTSEARYWARVSGDCSGTDATSCETDTREVTVTPSESDVHFQPLVVSATCSGPCPPQGAVAYLPADSPMTTLTVQATLSGPPGNYSYQWYYSKSAREEFLPAAAPSFQAPHAIAAAEGGNGTFLLQSDTPLTLSLTRSSPQKNWYYYVTVTRSADGAVWSSDSIQTRIILRPSVSSAAFQNGLWDAGPSKYPIYLNNSFAGDPDTTTCLLYDVAASGTSETLTLDTVQPTTCSDLVYVTPYAPTTYRVAFLSSSPQGGTPTFSNAFTITPHCKPILSPLAFTVTEGQSVSFLAYQALGGTTMQLYRNGQPVGPPSNVTRPDAHSEGSASFRDTPPAGTFSYTIVSQGSFCDLNQSDPVTVTVTAAPGCPPVTISSATASGIATPGVPVTLSVSASGSSLSYAWYQGTSGGATDASHLIGTAPNIAITATYPTLNYWVRVTSSCGSHADSQTVTVTCPTCAGRYRAVAHPTSQQIVSGQTAHLDAPEPGTGHTYEWRTGSTYDLAQTPFGAASGVDVTPSVTTSYWVRTIDSASGLHTDSDFVVITVLSATSSDIAVDPASREIGPGEFARLTAPAGSGFVWHSGTVGDPASPVLGNDPSLIAWPSDTTSYWLQYTDAQGVQRTSGAVEIRVRCDSPQILVLVSPAGGRITNQQFATLTASGIGKQLLYTWYQGEAGDTSLFIANGPTIAPNVTTSSAKFWVRAVDSCGQHVDAAPVLISRCVPTIQQQPADGTVPSAGEAVLTVGATSSNASPLGYQWFVGNPGDESNPVPGATSATLHVHPTTTTRYFAEVSGSCNDDGPPARIASTAALVTVCSPPAIVSITPSMQYVQGAAVTLQVSASGSSLTYQWYRGTTGVTSQPIANATTTGYGFVAGGSTVGSYWVRITNQAACPLDSPTIVVSACDLPTITQQPASTWAFSGGSADLNVSATSTMGGTLSYRWYQGTAGTTSAPIGTNAPTLHIGSLTSQTSYWVSISNGICSTASATATVSICALPQTVGAAPSLTSSPGQSVRLQLPPMSPSNNQYRFYRGATGDTSTPLTGQQLANYLDVAPTSTTQYWAQVQNGSCVSNTPTTTVNVCIPVITAEPQSVTVISGQSTTVSVQSAGKHLSVVLRSER